MHDPNRSSITLHALDDANVTWTHEIKKACVDELPRVIDSVQRQFRLNHADRDDLFQETYIEMLKCAGRFDAEKGSISGWIRVLARSKACRMLRTRKAERRALAGFAQSRYPDGECYARPETNSSFLDDVKEHARRCVENSGLSEQTKKLGMEVVLNEKNHKEVARKNNVDSKVVHMAAFRVRTVLLPHMAHFLSRCIAAPGNIRLAAYNCRSG